MDSSNLVMKFSSMEINQVVLWGATGQAKVLKECLGYLGVSLVAFFDNYDGLESPFAGIPIHYGKKGFEKWKAKQNSETQFGFSVAIGGERGKDRVEIQGYLESEGLTPLIIKHPTAFVAENAIIAKGSQILANSAICIEAKIGRSCIINTGATVDHECILGDGIHIGPGAHLAGNIMVGDYATIYTGAVVLPRVEIGKGAIVGAGAVVVKDVPAYTIVVGNPAKVLRKITNEIK